MMNKLAVMDIGTNSTRVMLAVLEDQKLMHQEKFVTITRIGQNVEGTKTLTSDGMDRTIAALSEFKKKAEEFGVEEICCFATSAVRDANNKQEFIDKVRNELGIIVEILTGEEEATVGYLGAQLGMEVDEKPVVVVDIGGGSTEIIVGNHQGILAKKSIDMGSVRFTELYGENLDNIKLAVQTLLQKEGTEFIKYTVQQCIGIAGTITTIAAMDQQMEVYDPNCIIKYVLTREMIEQHLFYLMGMSIEERKNVKGLQPKRADIIHAGMVILLEIMDFFKLEYIVVNDCDNLEGIVLKRYCQ